MSETVKDITVLVQRPNGQIQVFKTDSIRRDPPSDGFPFGRVFVTSEDIAYSDGVITALHVSGGLLLQVDMNSQPNQPASAQDGAMPKAKLN